MAGSLKAEEYLRTGELDHSIRALTQEIRENPVDPKLRTFLFELLCFAGDYDRAEKQLEIIAQGGRSAEIGSYVYRSVLHAERARQQFFRDREYLNHPELPSRPGTLDGNAFEQISDADPRIGARLEVFVAGAYVWLPFEHITSIQTQAPKRLRDLIWMPAIIHTAASFRGRDMGEVLLPVLSPASSQHPDDQVKLGRVTVWEPLEDGVEAPFGQKLLLVDGREVPVLELRKVEMGVAAAA